MTTKEEEEEAMREHFKGMGLDERALKLMAHYVYFRVVISESKGKRDIFTALALYSTYLVVMWWLVTSSGWLD